MRKRKPIKRKNFDNKIMNEDFMYLRDFLTVMEECDPNEEQLSQVCREKCKMLQKRLPKIEKMRSINSLQVFKENTRKKYLNVPR